MPTETRDHDPHWGLMFRSSAELEALKEAAAEKVRNAYDATTRAIADGLHHLGGERDAPVDKFKAGLATEMQKQAAPAAQNKSAVAPVLKAVAAPGLSDGSPELMTFVAKGEGTLRRGDGYDETYGYGRYVPEGTKPTAMTLDEVLALQGEMLRRGPSSALGRYQFTRDTLIDFGKNRLKLTGQEKFTPELQDRVMRRMLQAQGYDDFLAGRIDAAEFQRRMSGRWDSWAYDESDLTRPRRGAERRKALVSSGEIQAVLGKLKADRDRAAR